MNPTGLILSRSRMQVSTDARIAHMIDLFFNGRWFWLFILLIIVSKIYMPRFEDGFESSIYALPIALQEKCSDIIDYAAAELRDVCDGFQSTINCPVLSSLASADRTKAVALNWFVICHLHFLLYISPKYHDRLLGYIIYILIYITPPGFYMLLNTVAIFLEPLQLMIKEYAVTSVFRLNGLYYPVDITTEESAPLNSFPWIKPSNFIRSMVRMNDLDHLLGGFTLPQARGRLVDFWAKYRVLFPRHQLWEDVDAGRKTLLVVSQFSYMVTRGSHTRKMDYWFWVSKEFGDMDHPKGTWTTGLWMKESPSTSYELDSKRGCWFAYVLRSIFGFQNICWNHACMDFQCFVT